MTGPSHLRTTRAAYDAVAVKYAEFVRAELDRRPLDRALLAAFAELVRAGGAGRVADVGCGPGRIAAHLNALGLTVFGVDLSPAMVGLARQQYPDLRFYEGSMTDLELVDGALGGVVSWFSLIHTPPEQVPGVLAEFHRVLAPGGHLLLAFQAGDDPLAEPFDHTVAVAYRWSPDRMADLVRQAGFAEVARLRREAERDERFPQGYVLARRPEPAGGSTDERTMAR
jgi:SAM-dependent methyltransferase